jgi:phage-related protein
MPSHKKAAMRSTEYYVKGRDGALHVDEGYENFDIVATLVLLNAGINSRLEVNAWADGTGKLILSDDLTHAYMASVKDEVQWTRVKANGGFYDSAEITFNCQPFLYEAVDSMIEFVTTGSIINPGSAEAFPLIKVEGAGDASFSVNGNEISIASMTANVPVYIDCANGYVYTDSGATSMTGEIPVLTFGTNTITFGSNVTKITLTPHWRWV